MTKNLYPGKPSTRAKPRTRAELGSGLSRTELRSGSGLGAGLVPHLSSKKENQKKKWFVTLSGRPILPHKKGAGFIVIEGLDGSGQSTQAELLRDFLIKEGYEVVLTKEPTLDSEAGKKIRKVLDKKEKVSPKELQELFTQDRKEHLKKTIIPALKEGKIVISDRYFFSTFAYGKADGLDLDWLIKMNDEFLLPDLTFILKVSPEVCLARIKKRGMAKTLFEEKKKLAKVWQTYRNLPKRFKNVYPSPLPKGGGIYIIEGEKPIEEVFSQIKKILSLVIIKKGG